MDKYPLISVIVPVYNVEEYLDDCIQSILDQNYNNIEIILVDDGSSDKSGIKCDRWSQHDKRIQVIHKSNGGLSDARNVGILHAKGKYLTFIDSDDIMNQSMLEYLYNLIRQHDADISICDVVHAFPERDITYQNETQVLFYDGEQAICEMLYQTAFLPSACAKLYRSKLFDENKFPYGMTFEDVAILYKLFYISSGIVYGNAKLYAYRHRENSITTKGFSENDLDILKICEQQLEFSEDKSEKIRDAVHAYVCVGALRIFLNAPRKKYSEEIKKSEELLKTFSSEVLHNKNCRKKLKYALILYKYCRFFMKIIYKHINRWK